MLSFLPQTSDQLEMGVHLDLGLKKHQQVDTVSIVNSSCNCSCRAFCSCFYSIIIDKSLLKCCYLHLARDCLVCMTVCICKTRIVQTF